jgi:hypothetical protein
MLLLPRENRHHGLTVVGVEAWLNLLTCLAQQALHKLFLRDGTLLLYEILASSHRWVHKHLLL